jgi:hypothetical protein
MSSIFETFYILFESDASDVKKGTEQAKKSTDSLNKSLSTTGEATQKIGQNFKNLITQLGGTLTALIGTAAIVGGLKASLDYANKLDRLSKEMGINAGMIDVWSRAVKSVGGSEDAFQGSLQGLIDRFGKVATFTKILPKLADRMHGLRRIRAFELGKQFGLDEGTITLLRKGRGALDEIIKKEKELGYITKQDTDAAAKFTQEWRNVGSVFQILFAKLNTDWIPIFLKFTEKVQGFVREITTHREIVTGSLYAIGAAALFVGRAFLPFILITGAVFGLIYAIGLLYEDIQVFKRGGDSLIGDIFKDFPMAEKFIKGIMGAFDDWIEKIKLLWGAWDSMWGAVFAGFDAGIELIKKMGNLISDFLAPKLYAIADFIASKLGGGNIGVTLSNADSALQAARNSPISASSMSALTRSGNAIKNVTVTIGDINVNSPYANSFDVATQVQSQLRDQLRQAINNSSDGVVA